MNNKEETTATTDGKILEEVKKVTSPSLKKKLLYLGYLNKQREDIEDKDFQQEYQVIKNQYEALYMEVYNEIEHIVKGDVVPILSQEDKTKYTVQDTSAEVEKGIPGYWSTVLNNAKFFTINDKDVAILEHLTNLKVKTLNETDFTVEFEFRANEYFTDTALTKTYVHNPKSEELTKTTGCQIHWTSPDKNPRIKKQVKNIKKGKKSEKKTTEKIIPSFFDIYADQEGDDLGIAEEEGKFIKDDLLPNSLEYYLNILAFEEEDEEDEDEEDEHDEDEPAHAKKKVKKSPKPEAAAPSTNAESKEKCKNQ